MKTADHVRLLQQQYGCKPRQCFICRESPKGRRVQLDKDGPLLCDKCAEIAYKIRLEAKPQEKKA